MPAAEDEAAEAAEKAPLAPGSGAILLVEDEDVVRRMTAKMLNTIGYTVQVAATPQEGLSLCQESDRYIDLLITDVVMPGMNGAELRDRVESIRPGIKVLFMSGYTADIIIHHGVLDDDVYFIQKPFTMDDLARQVRAALGDP